MPRSPSTLPGRPACSSICTDSGITLVEVLIALLLLSTGIFALMSLQSSSWTLAGRSDYLGRAAGILQRQLQAAEARIMNPAAALPAGSQLQENVYASGQAAALAGDAVFSVETTAADAGNGATIIRVRVFWPGNPAGISESLIAGRQETFRQ